MATSSSILDWRIPCTEEPGGLQSIPCNHRRVRHDLATKQQQKIILSGMSLKKTAWNTKQKAESMGPSGLYLAPMRSGLFGSMLNNRYLDYQWQPTPVLLPEKSHGWRSLVGFSPWGRWVGHDWAASLSLFPFMHWRRKWQPTPVFLPGESQGWGGLVGCRLWGRTESDMTDVT